MSNLSRVNNFIRHNIFYLFSFIFFGDVNSQNTIDPCPLKVYAITNNPVVCRDGISNLRVNITDGNPEYKFKWNDGNTQQFRAVFDLENTTTYTVTVTDANHCSATSSVAVDVKSPPVISFSPPKPVICQGNSIRITATAGIKSNNYSYVWNSSTDIDNSLVSNPLLSPRQTTVYTVTITEQNYGCSSTESISVQVEPRPVASIITSANQICKGDSIALKVSVISKLPVFSYQWSAGLGTSSFAKASPIANTPYTVTVTDSLGCSAIAGALIFVNSPPSVLILPSKIAVCQDSVVKLKANVSGGKPPYSYKWNLDGVNNSEIKVKPQKTTRYNVVLTDSNKCSASTTVNVDVVSAIKISTMTDNDTVCLGKSVHLIARSTGGNQPYLYKWGNIVSASDNIFVKPTSSTTYSVTVSEKSHLHCSSVAHFSVFVRDTATKPEAIFRSPKEGVSNDHTITLALYGESLGKNNPGAHWVWYAGQDNKGVPIDSYKVAISVFPLSTTNYYVRAEGGCNTTNPKFISLPKSVAQSDSKKETFYSTPASKTITVIKNIPVMDTIAVVQNMPISKSNIDTMSKSKSASKEVNLTKTNTGNTSKVTTQLTHQVTSEEHSERNKTTIVSDKGVSVKPEISTVDAGINTEYVTEEGVKSLAAETLYKFIAKYNSSAPLKPYDKPLATVETASAFTGLFEQGAVVVDEIKPIKSNQAITQFNTKTIEHYVADNVEHFPKGFLVTITKASIDFSNVMKYGAEIFIEKYISGISPKSNGQGTNLYKSHVIESISVKFINDFTDVKITKVGIISGELNCADCD